MTLRILLGRNFIEDAFEKIVSVRLPNGDTVVITELGEVLKIAKDGVYEPEWRRTDGDLELHQLLTPDEGKFGEYEKVRRENKLIVRTEIDEFEIGEIIEF